MAKSKGTPTKNKNTPTKAKSPTKRDKNGLLQPKITAFFANPGTSTEPKRKLTFERKPNNLLPNYFQPQSSTASTSSTKIKVEDYDTDDSEVEILPTPPKPVPIVVTLCESEGDSQSQELKLDDDDEIQDKKETDADKENKDKEIDEKNKRMEVDLEIIGEFNFSRPGPTPNLPSTSSASTSSASTSTNINNNTKSDSSDTDNIIITASISAPPKPIEKEVEIIRRSNRKSANANVNNKTFPQKLNEMETQVIDFHLDGTDENDANKSLNDSLEEENDCDDDDFVPSKESMDTEENSTCSSSNTTPPNTPSKKQSFKSPTKSPKKNLTKFSPTRQMINRTKSGSNISPRRELFPQKETTTSVPAKFTYFDLEDFLSVINLVISDQLNAHLFDDIDMSIVNEFTGNLSVQAQALYVKLFGRKWCYKMVKDYSYPNIHNTDLLPFFVELHSKGFVLSLQDENLPLEEILDILKEDQLNGLVKRMNLKITSRNKDHQKAALLKLTTTQKTIRGDSKEILIRNAKNALGPTYKISERSRSLFTRINIINAPPQYYDDEQSVQSNTKTNFYLVNTGQVVYPSYEIYKTKPIYENRQELLDFHEAWGLHTVIQVHIENKNFDEVLKILDDQVLDKVKILLEDKVIKSIDEKLPEYLRVYKSTNIYIKILWMCVDALQKSKEYEKSNFIIMELLLKQNIYCTRYRGRWYERVIINSRHLGLADSEIRDIIVKALGDTISDNYKYDFTLRKKKIDDMISKKKKVVVKPKPKSKKKKRKRLNKNSKKGKNSSEESSSDENDDEDSGFDVEEKAEDIPELNLNTEIPSITIEGEKMENYGQMGKSVFLGTGNENGNGTASSVEYFAMGYYKTQGYTFGLHGEGSLPATLYGLIFWDIIYSDKIPNVFFSKFQPFPLDFHFPDFYENRKQLIEDRLRLISSGCGQEIILDLMHEIWTNNLNRLSIVNWSLFSSFEDVTRLVKSMGHEVLSQICEKFAKNYRFSHKGFPDLVVWNGEKCIFSEVKGPNDKLSSNQIVWLNELKNMGANAQVCLVKAVSNKRIRLSH